MTQPVTLIGKKLPGVDAREKALGRVRFVQDIILPGMVHAACVLAGRPHARIDSIDISRAACLPGVVGVVTAKDVLGSNRVGLVVDDQPLFAETKVRYEGDCLALVGAESVDIARHAAELVRVSYSNLLTVPSIDDAKSPDAVSIHEGGNLAVERLVEKGDIGKGEDESEVIVERTFLSPPQEHAYLETLGAVVIPTGDRSVDVFAPAQCPFYVRDAVARCIGAKLADVRVIQLPIGGGFGGKEDVPSEICARLAVLALKCQRPARLLLTREEDIIYSSKRHPMRLSYRMGCDRNGRIRFADLLIEADVGAYATLSPIVLFRSTVHAAGPYEIPNVRVITKGYYTNTAPKGAMRGFGTPQVVFACESVIDELAEKIGIDPLDMRLLNALREGSLTATSQRIDEQIKFRDTLIRAKEIVGNDWRRRLAETSLVQATGVASMFYGVSLGAVGSAIDRAGARVEILKDGSINVWIGCTDMGQGAMTVLRQITGQALGVDLERIRVNRVDTSAVPDSGPTVASRTTLVCGNAIIDACSKLIDTLSKVASDLIGGTARFESGHFRNSKGDSVGINEVMKKCFERRLDLSASGWFAVPECRLDKSGKGKAYHTYSFATDIARVEVDLSTGTVRLVDFVAIHDSGRIINKLTSEGQVEGGIAQGIGLSLLEVISQADGHILSKDFSTYLIPTAADICDKINVEFIESDFQGGPFGAKGLGEPAIIAVAASIANAVSRAVGTRVLSLPISPEWITMAARK
ncbi:MAG: xanthine dehydrogenase family protein molybdopterin-binding subunit [bacterium]